MLFPPSFSNVCAIVCTLFDVEKTQKIRSVHLQKLKFAV